MHKSKLSDVREYLLIFEHVKVVKHAYKCLISNTQAKNFIIFSF